MIFKYIHVASCRNLRHPRLKLGTNKMTSCYFPHFQSLVTTFYFLICLSMNLIVCISYHLESDNIVHWYILYFTLHVLKVNLYYTMYLNFQDWITFDHAFIHILSISSFPKVHFYHFNPTIMTNATVTIGIQMLACVPVGIDLGVYLVIFWQYVGSWFLHNFSNSYFLSFINNSHHTGY